MHQIHPRVRNVLVHPLFSSISVEEIQRLIEERVITMYQIEVEEVIHQVIALT